MEERPNRAEQPAAEAEPTAKPDPVAAARARREQREQWRAALNAKQSKPRNAMGKQVGKGIGPNKACGHKGGICRQGSKRG